MTDRKKEREDMLHLQRVFFIECAIRYPSTNMENMYKVNEMIYKIEHIRRDVEYTRPQID